MGVYGLCVFFFFKQKTAYEMLRSLVGSEMCIRDRAYVYCQYGKGALSCAIYIIYHAYQGIWKNAYYNSCLLYTSDAADDLLCVDLGGRRII